MKVNSGDIQPNLTMRNALAVQQKLCFPLLRKGGGPLSPPQHVRVPLEFPSAAILHQRKSSDPGGTP